MVLVLVTSALAVLQNIYRDIFKNWGLLRRHSQNPYLRDELIVPLYKRGILNIHGNKKLIKGKRVCSILLLLDINSISFQFHRSGT
ncbi:hypothetical protein AAZV13_06G265400 [Glycine max]